MCDGNADFDTRAHTHGSGGGTDGVAGVRGTFDMSVTACHAWLQGMARRKWVQGGNPFCRADSGKQQHSTWLSQPERKNDLWRRVVCLLPNAKHAQKIASVCCCQGCATGCAMCKQDQDQNCLERASKFDFRYRTPTEPFFPLVSTTFSHYSLHQGLRTCSVRDAIAKPRGRKTKSGTLT